ncbi:DUF192 domain-containing protein [Telmatospirillum sp.]|uniref:DUF192 domain-containing protein n=1 Tax=Telmatospirillum sp. TaxID=2079197 RepID=UPI0028481834|nr:DUF192 domain-containing protein [Telmatospirillum sp.]MDR3435706.1 DUF192 domain-containing protein [Telmatospirillum sp.]
MLFRRFLFMLLVLLPLPVFAEGSSALTIETEDGRSVPFSVEVARTTEELGRGLMNRSSLPADAGMLFDFGSDHPVSMWMKNTLIPLDMLFITNDGKIAGIAARTVPQSLEVIASPGSVRAVLELNGGTADRVKIKVGDRVSVGLPIFTR